MDDDFIKHLADDINDIKKTQIKVLTELATLKVKSGVWGMLAGALGSFIIYFIRGLK